MKLRITPNAIRFRINKNELADLIKGEVITERVEVAPDSAMEYQVSLAHPTQTPRLSCALLLSTIQSTCDMTIHLQVVPTVLEDYARTDHQRQGIEDLHVRPNGQDLLIALEVDIGQHA